MSRADITQRLRDAGMSERAAAAALAIIDDVNGHKELLVLGTDAMVRIADRLGELVQVLQRADREPVGEHDGFRGHKPGCDHDWMGAPAVARLPTRVCTKCGRREVAISELCCRPRLVDADIPCFEPRGSICDRCRGGVGG